VFFAGHAKQQQAESDTHEAPAQENSHNALAQLSASLVTCKLKAHDSSALIAIRTAVVAAFVSNAGARRGERLYK
jgi:hypothetical protein